MRRGDRALNALRSSSRRSCQNPRLTIVTIADDHEQVEAEPARGNRKRYMAGGTVPAPAEYGRARSSATWNDLVHVVLDGVRQAAGDVGRSKHSAR